MRLAVTTSHWMMMKIITIINFEAFISTLFPFLLLAPFYCEKHIHIILINATYHFWHLLCDEMQLM